MKKTGFLLLVAAAAGVTGFGLFASGYEYRETEYQEASEHEDGRDYRERAGGSTPAYMSDSGYVLYKSECGDCHLAYPPSMLPAAAWEGVMGSLADHFGDNAELDVATADRIGAFLSDNAAGKARSEYGERTKRAVRRGAPPLRITQTDYFRGQHHEIPAKIVTGNAAVGSFSRCDACHVDAEKGDFSEHRVRIPGVGRWDD
jgi:hypothetical protein